MNAELYTLTNVENRDISVVVDADHSGKETKRGHHIGAGLELVCELFLGSLLLARVANHEVDE